VFFEITIIDRIVQLFAHEAGKAVSSSTEKQFSGNRIDVVFVTMKDFFRL